jgi:peptidyl-prolyl cis-trans isomerase C
MKFRFLILALIFSSPLFADNQVATVNGVAMDKSLMAAQVRQQFGNETAMPPANTPQYQMLLEELIGREILFQQALAASLDKQPNVIADLENMRRNILSAAYMQHWIANHAPSEQALQAEYERQAQMTPPTQYKTSHILLNTEAEAQAVLAQLQAGGDFAELAKQHSIHPTKEQAGDLGWLTLPLMLPPYAHVVANLSKGQVATEAVQTPMGWHIVRLDDTRPMPKPSLEEAKPGLANALKMSAWQQHLMQLRNQAKIERE